MRVLGISGSLRAESHNTKLLRAAGELFEASGIEFAEFDGLKDVPPYDEDEDLEPALVAVSRLRDAVAGADAILFATPEYNSSVPGQLKNALDWVSRPIQTNVLRNKPVVVIGASNGMFGAVWSQAELRKVCSAIGARVFPNELAVGHAHTRFDAAGNLTDYALREQLEGVVDVLVNELTAAREERATAAAA